MAYRKVFRTVIPVERGKPIDDDVLVWLTRESFELLAARKGLVLVEFTQSTLRPSDIPPAVDKQIGRAAADFNWRVFEGVGERATGD